GGQPQRKDNWHVPRRFPPRDCLSRGRYPDCEARSCRVPRISTLNDRQGDIRAVWLHISDPADFLGVSPEIAEEKNPTIPSGDKQAPVGGAPAPRFRTVQAASSQEHAGACRRPLNL